nr:MAG TPA: hypothetical protein [Bacteriophage sp.]
MLLHYFYLKFHLLVQGAGLFLDIPLLQYLNLLFEEF